MSVASHINRGRARHALLMLDSCTVTRIVPGTRSYNAATQDYAEETEIVYTGPCRLKIWRGTDEQAAETEVNVQRYYVDLPLTGVTPPAVARRDLLTVTTSQNPKLAGRVLVLTDVETETTDTALRVTCEFQQ